MFNDLRNQMPYEYLRRQLQWICRYYAYFDTIHCIFESKMMKWSSLGKSQTDILVTMSFHWETFIIDWRQFFPVSYLLWAKSRLADSFRIYANRPIYRLLILGLLPLINKNTKLIPKRLKIQVTDRTMIFAEIVRTRAGIISMPVDFDVLRIRNSVMTFFTNFRKL